MNGRKGFSLLELVVVLAIFALVALIGVQVIQATVRSSDRLTEVSEQSAELALALALLRQDLGAALPRAFTPPNGGTEPALSVGSGGFSLTVGGLVPLSPNASGLGRVTWKLVPGSDQLVRQVWTTLTPGGGRPAETIVLTGIERLELDSYQAQSAWRPGFSPDPRNIGELPLGLRVRIEHIRLGTLETLVSLR